MADVFEYKLNSALANLKRDGEVGASLFGVVRASEVRVADDAQLHASIITPSAARVIRCPSYFRFRRSCRPFRATVIIPDDAAFDVEAVRVCPVLGAHVQVVTKPDRQR